MTKYGIIMSEDCKETLSKVGTITYVTDLMPNYLFMESVLSVSELMAIKGVSVVEKNNVFTINW